MPSSHDHSHSHGHHSCSSSPFQLIQHDEHFSSVGNNNKGSGSHPTPTTIASRERSQQIRSKADSDENHEQQQQAEVLRRLKMAMGLCGSFFVVEVVGGYFSGSLAVLSDAAHLFADLASFAVAIAAAHLASLPPTDYHTFGLKRTESLAALLSMISLALVSVYLAVEAIQRLYRILSPLEQADEVDGKLMSQVAAIGVLVNLALAWVLGVENHIHLPGADHDHSHDHDHHGHGHHDHQNEHNSRPSKYMSTSHEHGHDHHHDEMDHNEHDHDHHNSHQPVDSSIKLDVESSPFLGTKHHEDHHDHSHKDYSTLKAGRDRNGNKDQTKPLLNVNLHAAYLHVFGDLLQSLGVLLAGLAIWYNSKWAWVDPICTLFFCVIVFCSTLSVLRNSVSVLLQETPANLSWQQIYKAIESVEGVHNVHDLHIWSISHGNPALAVHCSSEGDPQVAMREIKCVLEQEFAIHHVTIQIQQGEGHCITCEQNVGCDNARLEEMNSFNNANNTT